MMDVLDFPSTDLSRELSLKFGYSEFILRRWIGFFGENETVKLVEAMEDVPKYIRVNTVKVKERALIERIENRGFKLRKTEVPYCYEVVEEPYSLGATPEYLMGYYYIMDKSSCIPPIVLSEEFSRFEKEVIRVADFAASPGGKTTMLSQIMKDRRVSGIILALEAKRDRIQPLVDNIHRMGVNNVAVFHMDARKFPEFRYEVDAVILDAPCSGEGIIHKDKSRKVSRGAEDIAFCSSLQRELLKSAVDCTKEGGVIVYSTCSLTPEENEFVVQWAVENLPVEIDRIDFPGRGGLKKAGNFEFDSRMRFTRRYFPHTDRCSGFFVAKLRVV